MTNDEIIKELAENTQRAKSNSHRIDELERNTEILNKMVSSLNVLANNQQNMSVQIEKIDGKVTRLEEAPIKKWQAIFGYIVAALSSAGAAIFLGIYL
jgi:hypothetical protein